MKTGLVLEGGAMRGMFTAGVLDVLMEQGIHFDAIIGVSAGALFGVNFLSGQKGRTIRYNKKFNQDKRYMGVGSLLKTGNFVNTEYAYHMVPYELDKFDNDAYIKNQTPFYAVVTEMEKGKPEYIEITDVFQQMDVLRASGSMPFVSKPVILDGKEYLDGGVSDSIPYRKLKSLGYDRLVVILTRDMNYRKKPMSDLPISLLYKNYPVFQAQLRKRHEVYNRTVDRLKTLEERGEVFIIRPSRPITIDRVERKPEKLQSVYELGIKDGNTQLADLQKFMEERVEI